MLGSGMCRLAKRMKPLDEGRPHAWTIPVSFPANWGMRTCALVQTSFGALTAADDVMTGVADPYVPVRTVRT